MKEDCPNCNGHGRFHKFVESDREVDEPFGNDHRVIGGECARCGGTGKVES